MSTRQYSNYADLITFSRASGGTALRPISYGDELVTNGTFDTDTAGWTAEVGVAATVSGGQVQLENTAAGTGRGFYQEVTTEIGKIYQVSGFVNVNLGGSTSLRAGTIVNGGNLSLLTATGSSFYYGYFKATTITTYIGVFIGGVDGEGAIIDNISVREVLFDQAGAPLTLFNHPANTPRIEYDADGNRLGLLVEEARTNLLTYSEQFDNAAWVKLNTTVTANATAAPYSTLTADKLIESATNTAHQISETASIAAGSTTSFSVFVKEDERAIFRLQLTNAAGSSGVVCGFDLTAGTIQAADPAASFGTGSAATAAISLAGDGWYRCTLSGVVDASSTSALTTIRLKGDGAQFSYLGDGTSGIYVWGAQLEAGAFPTSYIPTAGATVTRSADIASIPVADFGYNQSEGTVVVDINTPLSTGEVNYAFALDDGGVLNMAYIYRGPSGTVVASTNNSGINQGDLSLKTNALGNNKAAYALSTNDSAAVCTGESVQTDVSYSVPTVTDLVIGDRGAGSRELNGHIKSIKYYPRRLTNAQLQELTS